MLPISYLDPGSGSLLLYALFGLSATAFFFLRGIWYNVRSFLFMGGGARQLPKTIPDLVIHSEGSKYWQVFQPVLAALDDMGIACAYVTPDKDDCQKAKEYKNVISINPGREIATLAYMNRIKAKLVITTTPHLDIYMLKRSKHVLKYAYLFHAPTSIDHYEKYAFDFYDIMLCPGEFVGNDIRTVEAKRHLTPKRLFFTGCTYYDYMVKERELLEVKRNERTTVLYAVTWGARSSVVKYGVSVLEQLINSGYNIIFRPHPQLYITHAEEIKAVENWIKKNPSVVIDRNRTGMDSMGKADILVSDNSGIIFDFAYLYEKPVVLLDTDINLQGYEGSDLEESWNDNMCKALSKVIQADEIEELAKVVDIALESKNIISDKIRKLRDGELMGFGQSGKLVADAIEQLLKENIR